MDLNLYEKSRIKNRSHERDLIQKSLFTNWINAQLDGVYPSEFLTYLSYPNDPHNNWTCYSGSFNTSMPRSPSLHTWQSSPCTHRSHSTGHAYLVKELYNDLRDGRILLRLLELLSGRHFARTNHSHMRIHQLENINRALDFLSEEGAHLENVGAQDIVDGNPRLTLGLIWTIILHYQVQDIIVKESDETGEVRHAKDALLLWCQLKTAGYPQVEIVDFTKSWRDSLAFAALLHRHYPNLIDFDEIRCIENSQVRLEIIFQQAYLHLGIPILIESKDFIQTCWLEERCVLTLVATWYRCLTTSHSAQLSCERVTKVIQQSLAISHRIFEYMKQTKRWLKWCSVNNKLLNQLLVKLNATDAIRNELDVKQELQNLLSWRQKEKAEKMSDLVQLETLLSEIHTSQLAASHRLFKPPNGLHLNDLEESWKSLTIVEHNCHLAIIDELLRRENLEILGQKYERKTELCLTWLQENIQIIRIASSTEDMKFLEHMNSLENYFINICSKQFDAVYQFPQNELITYRHQITSSRHKHAALISDTETYVNLKLQRLCELSSILTSSINYSLRDKYKKQWNMILEGNRKLQDKLNSRENYLKLCQEWLDLLLQLNDQLQKFGIKMLQLKHLTEVNRTNSVDTCLDQIQMDMNQLVIWIESVKDLLNNITSSENRHIDDSESDATPRTHLQMNVVNSLNYIERYRSNLEKNLWETSQWNVAVKNVYRLLNEINEELLWIKDQENSIEPPNFNKNELAEHFSCVSITTHQLQSKSRLLDAELQSRYKVNYFHHSFLVSNQSLCKHLQQVISQINPADFYQLSIDDINSLSIIHSTQLLEKSQEYPEKMINELNKCVLIKIYEDILKCMQELYTQSDNSNNSNDQNSSPNTSDTCEEIRCKERQTKTIEFVGLLQRYWSKLLESIKVIQNKLLQHNHYLNVLHSLVLANMKIEETSLRICETYNSVNITLMLANKTGNVEEFEEDKQSQKESQMGTLLKEPFDMLNAHTALTVDKEVVINSTLRQMDHIIEQLKLFPKHLIRLRKEVSIFLVSKSVLNENDYAEYLRLETKLNNLSTHRQQRKEIRFQSAHKVDDDQGEDKSTSYSDNVSVTGAQTISSSFEDEVVPVIHKWSIEEEEEIKDERQEEKDDTQTEKPIEQGETINIKKDDGQDVSFTNESVENIAVFTSALSKSSCEELREDNDSDEYFENDFKTPLNSPEAHELSILLLPHISTIAYYLLNRLDFIHMNLKDYVEDCLRQRDILEIQRNVLRLVDNVTSLESWIEEKEKILLTFNPIIYPSVKFIQSLPKPCPIVVTKEIIQSISQLSVQAYRFKTFENELKSHANLRLSEIGMLDQGLCDTFSKLDKEKDMDILHFIKATIKINSPGDEYDVDEDNEDEDEEEGSESRDEFSQETHEEIHFEDSNKQEEEESPHEKKTATYDAYEDEEADDEEVEEEEEQRQQQRHRRNKIDIFRSKYSKLLDHVTKRWQRLKILIEARHERFELAATLSTFHTLFQSTKEWIIRKRELLISTDDLGTDLNSVMQLQRRLMGWERDFIALQGEVEHLNVEGEKLAKELIDEAPQRRDLYLISGELYASKEVGELIKELNKEWESLQLELRNRQDKLLASAELQQFFQGLDDNQLWLRNIEISVATHQLPQSVEEAKIELDLHKELGEQILARKEEFADLISYGRCITAGETDIHYVQLDQRLDRLENGWSELMQMWTYQQKLLQQDVKIQTFFRDAHSFETLLSTQENKLMSYQLIKQKDTTTILSSLEPQNEIVQCLIKAEETLNYLCDTGNQLVFERVYSMDKIQNKIFFMKNRYTKLLNEAREQVDSTKDMIALREELQQIQILQEWLTEKKEITEEWDETGVLSKKDSLIPYRVFVSRQYAQHRQMENELEFNNERVKQVFQAVVNTIVQYPRIADQLSEALGNLMALWENLRKSMRERGAYMVQLHRGIIFEDGCNELNRWLDKFFLKILTRRPPDSFIKFQEEHTEQDPLVLIENLLEYLTDECGLNLIDETESVGKILEDLLQNRYMQRSWTKKANEPVCISMNEANLHLNKITEHLNELDLKKKLLAELYEHSKVLSTLDSQMKKSEIDLKIQRLIRKFWKIQIFIHQHAEELKAQKHIYQLYRDLEDERIWTHEKLLLANDTYIGRSLFAVNQLIRQHRLLVNEVANRTKRTEITLQESDKIITRFQSVFQEISNNSFTSGQHSTRKTTSEKRTGEDTSECAEIELLTDTGIHYRIPRKILNDLYTTANEFRHDLKNLDNRLTRRTDRLNIGYQCFMHLTEFAELRGWLQECEDLLLLESRASRDTITAKTELRKHANIEFRVNNLLANCVREFNDKSLKLLNEFTERKEKLKNQLELIKTNESLEQGVKHYSQSTVSHTAIDELKGSSTENLVSRRKLRGQIKQIRKRVQVIQSIQQIMDRQYASLIDVCVQKRQRLEEILALNIVYEEVSDLKNWLNQQILMASSTYTGRNLNECVRIINQFVNFGGNLLGESFARFVEVELRSLDPIASSEYTMNISDQFVQSPGFAAERIERVMNMCRCLICTKHSDSPRIAFWQDILSETWADLRELINSRVKLLVTAAHRFVFVTRCSETLKLVQEKSDQLCQSIGKDVQVICKQLSLLSAFEQDVQALEPLVKWVENAADCLLPLYSGQWVKRLRQPRDNLLSVWHQLKERTKLRRIRLKRAIALYRWISNLDVLFNWIQQCQKELERIEMDIWNVNSQATIRKADNITTENIKYAIGQTLQLQAELNARQDKVMSCLDEGKRLNIAFKQPSGKYFKSEYQQHHQADELKPQSATLCTMQTEEESNTSIEEKQRPTASSLTVDATTEKDVSSKLSSIRPEYSDYHLKSVRIDEKHDQKSDTSSLSQSTLQNYDHVEDENDEIIQDLQARMTQLLTSWYNLHKKWYQICRRLELQLSINEFASVADSLEIWLSLHSSEVETSETGDSIKETLTLIDRLEILERNLLPQKERYEKVKQLTKFEIIDIEENMLNQPISCVNISRSSDTDELETFLKYYGLKRGEELDENLDIVRKMGRIDDGFQDGVELDAISNGAMEGESISIETFGDYLMRKHEWINHNCKSRDRSWYELYMVLNMSVRQLLAYKTKSDYNESNYTKVLMLGRKMDHIFRSPIFRFYFELRSKPFIRLIFWVLVCFVTVVFTRELIPFFLLSFGHQLLLDIPSPESNTFRGEMGLLIGPNLLTANETLDYTKRPNTFRVTVTSTGAQYLFQAPNSEIMSKWITSIQNANQQKRPTSGPTMITLSRPSEELESPLVIMDIQGTPATSKKSTLTQILRSKTTQQISCIRRHSSGQDDNDVDDFVQSIESSQIRIRRFPSVRTMKALSPRQVMRWLTFKYSSISSASSTASHQTPTLLRSSTSHNIESEQSYPSVPVLRKSQTSGSLHKISRFSISKKSSKEI